MSSHICGPIAFPSDSAMSKIAFMVIRFVCPAVDCVTQAFPIGEPRASMPTRYCVTRRPALFEPGKMFTRIAQVTLGM